MARAALLIAERKGQSILRYADVAVLASVLSDDLGTTSLRQLYLEPLEGMRDGGKVARETLRAYFATQRNVPRPPRRWASTAAPSPTGSAPSRSSSAALLRTSRPTWRRRFSSPTDPPQLTLAD